MRSLAFALLASVTLAAPFSAQAFTASAGTNTNLPILALTGTGVHTGTISGVGVFGTITGGAVYGSTQTGTATQPFGTVGNFLAAGPSATSPAVMTFAQGLSYVSFLWGTPDTYNTLVVNYLLNGSAQTVSFSPTATGTVIGLTGDGQSSSDRYVQFMAGAGEVITSLSFQSPSTNAFESSNFRVTAAPGPIAGAGLVPLLGLASGWLTRRRRALAA